MSNAHELMRDQRRAEWRAARDELKAVEKARDALVAPIRKRLDDARDRVDAIEAEAGGLTGVCEACENPIFEGEPYSYSSIDGLHFCYECTPTVEEMLLHPDSFVASEDEYGEFTYHTAETARAWADKHVADGGAMTDKLGLIR